MIVAHLSELHLGFRAYDRAERGRNVRERDVASAFERAVRELGRLRPDLVLVAGDVFDRADPPPSAFLSLTRGLDALRSLLPDVPVVMVAGARDTPLRPGDATALAVVESVPGVEVATGTARGITLQHLDVHVAAIPYRAGLREPFPSPTPVPRVRRSVLLAYGAVGTSGRGVPVDPAGWSYLALGGEHVHRIVAPRVAYAGSLERVGGSPWAEAAEEKGFVTADLESGRVRFHTLPVRPVVSLAPVRTPPGGPEELTERVREVTDEVPGGLDEKIVRLRVRGARPRDLLGLRRRLLPELADRTLHLDVEVEEDSTPGLLPLASDVLQRRLADRPEVAARIARLLDGEPEPPRPVSMRTRIEEDDPVLGRVELRVPEGILAVVSSDASATYRLLRHLPAAGRGPLPPWLDPSSAPPEELVDHLVDILARLRGVGPLEAVLRRIDTRSPGSPAPPPPDRAAAERRLAELEGAEREMRGLRRELRELRADHAEVAGDLEEATMEWLRERQDAETHLQAYRDRARELKTRLSQIESVGEEAPCPTCGRVLAERFHDVLVELREEWESVVQDGSWWKRRREQLDLKPERLQELEGRSLRLQAAVEGCTERLEQARARVAERDAVLRRLAGGDGGEGVARPEGAGGAAGAGSEVSRVLAEIVAEMRAGVRDRLLERTSRYLGVVTGSRVLALTRDDAGGLRLEGLRDVLVPADEEVAAAEVCLRIAGATLAAEEDDPVEGIVLPTSLVERLRQDDRLHLVDVLPSLKGRIRRVIAGMRTDTAERRHELLDGVLEVRPGGSVGPALRWIPAGPSRIVLTASRGE